MPAHEVVHMQVREGKVKNVTCKAAGELMQVGSQVAVHTDALVLDALAF